MDYTYAVSWKLLILGQLTEYFATFTQKTIPEESSCKMFHISSPIVLFSYGKVNDVFWGDKAQISSGEGKRKGGVRGGNGGEAQSEVFVCKVPIIKKDTNCIVQTVVQTNFLSSPLQLPCPKTWMQGLPSDFKQFLLVKNNFVYF